VERGLATVYRTSGGARAAFARLVRQTRYQQIATTLLSPRQPFACRALPGVYIYARAANARRERTVRMGDVNWDVVKQFAEAGYRLGEAQRTAAVAAAKRASGLGYLSFLENEALPYFESAEADVDARDVDFAHEINRKANVAKLALLKVQPPQTQPLPRGQDAPVLDGAMLARKEHLLERLDAVISKAIERARS
jgi:hypothetical protein